MVLSLFFDSLTTSKRSPFWPSLYLHLLSLVVSAGVLEFIFKQNKWRGIPFFTAPIIVDGGDVFHDLARKLMSTIHFEYL